MMNLYEAVGRMIAGERVLWVVPDNNAAIKQAVDDFKLICTHHAKFKQATLEMLPSHSLGRIRIFGFNENYHELERIRGVKWHSTNSCNPQIMGFIRPKKGRWND